MLWRGAAIGDIHGSPPVLDAVLAAIEAMGAPVAWTLLDYLFEPPGPSLTTEYFESSRGA